MTCPKCKKDIDLGKYVGDADKEWYQGIEPPILLMLSCEHCDEQVASISIEGGDLEFEDVFSPALDATVKVPKIKE